MMASNTFIQKVDAKLAPYLTALEKYVEKNEFLNKHLSTLEAKTKLGKKYLAALGIFIVAVYLTFGTFGGLLCNLIGFIHPGYQSIKAIDSHSKEDDTKWLTYWVVFSFFMICESFADLILSWFPFYWLAKCALLLWMSNYGGAVMVYDKFLRNFVYKLDDVARDGVKGLMGRSSAMGAVGEDNNEFKTE